MDSQSEVIVITGKKDSVEKAKEQIQSIQQELANCIQRDIIIPAKFHSCMIRPEGLIRSIREECEGVIIRFPPEGSGSDKVSIIGTKEMVNKAKEQLIDWTNDKLASSFLVEIKANPDHHRFLIGKEGSRIKKVKDKTGVKILFPSPSDENSSDRETIAIIGKKENVLQAKAELEAMIQDLEQIIEDSVTVPSKYHTHFKRTFLRQLKEDLANVTVTLPLHPNEEKFTLKGAKECVEAAKARIKEKVDELESQVSIEVVIPQKYHKFLMGRKGSNVKSIQAKCNVDIQFPKREINDIPVMNQEILNNNIHETENEMDEKNDKKSVPKLDDVIIVKGRMENCQEAKEALLASVPFIQDVEVPFVYHKFIIGKRGKDISILNESWDVVITVPPLTEHSNIIKVQGQKANVEKAVQAIKEKVQKLEEEKQDREARSFRIEIKVDPVHHSKLIGKRGQVITKVREDHNAQIQFPGRNDDGNQTEQDAIAIIGYEKNVMNAKEDIMKIVHYLESLVTEEILIDNRVHSRLIGQYGRNIRKIMDNFKVDVKFPKENSSNSNLVTITGASEDVENCKAHLLELQEEYVSVVY